MKKIILFSIIFFSHFISAAWQDWIPSYFKAPPIKVDTDPDRTYTFQELLNDPQLNKPLYSKLEASIKNYEYPSYPVFVNKNKNIQLEQKLRTNIYQEKAEQKKLETLQQNWFNRVAIYSAVGGTTGSLSALILRQLLNPRGTVSASVGGGFGAVTGFTLGYWHLAQKEKEKKEAIALLKKQRAI